MSSFSLIIIMFNAQVDETMDIMRHNIEGIVDRGTRLDEVQVQTGI